MRSHNLGTVIAFEFMRTITKARFWAFSLGLPLLMGAIVMLITASNSSVDSSVDAQRQASVSFTYTDASGLIDPGVAAAAGGRAITDAEAGRRAVQDGTSDAHVTYPADPLTQPTLVYGRDLGIFDSGRYSGIADRVMNDSVVRRIGDPHLAQLAVKGVDIRLTTYANGVATPGFAGVIVPGLFLVLFYVSILLLGNQMLNVTLEEKENRVTEMVLTMMSPTTLIVGKVIALVAIGVLQTAVFTLPSMLVFSFMRPNLGISDADLSAGVPIDPVPAVVGFLLFLGGFLMFTGLLVAIGAIMPNVREAGAAFGGIVMSMFVPFYAAPMIVTDPHGIAAQGFTFFPLTSPITALLRNAVGGLYWWETALVLVILFSCGALFLNLGVRLFRTGSITYDARLNLRKALARRRPA